MSSEGRHEHVRRGAFIQQAIMCDSLRGFDSTGIFYVPKENNQVDYYKHIYNGFDFVQTKYVQSILDNPEDYKVIVGHNRYKTSGTVERKDAHPHVYKHITLVHNGGISNDYTLPGYNYSKDAPTVDTYRLTMSVAEAGAVEAFSSAEGSFACVWWDAKDNTLNITRNDQRPLAICFADKNKTMCIASEWRMLDWLMDRNGIKKDDKINIITPYLIYKFSFAENGEISLTKEKYTKRSKAERSYYPTAWPHMGQRRWIDADDDDPVIILPPAKSPKQDVVPLNRSVPPKSKKEIGKINKRLQPKGLTYQSSIWTIPMMFHEYKHSTQGLGVGRFVRFHDSQKHIVNVYDTQKEEWDAVLASGIIAPITIINACANNEELVGIINWDKMGDTWTIAKTIPKDDDTVKFIPWGSPVETLITRKTFEKLIEKGCSFCKQPIKFEECNSLDYIDDLPVCTKCAVGI